MVYFGHGHACARHFLSHWSQPRFRLGSLQPRTGLEAGIKMNNCPDCGAPMPWGTECAVCRYGSRLVPAPVKGKLLASVCMFLIIVIMLTTMIAATHPGWLGF